MKEHLDNITSIIDTYYGVQDPTGTMLVEWLKDMTSLLYYLETERAKIHEQWQKVVFRLVSNGKTVSRAENEAHTIHPEMYKLRRVMDAGYRVVDAMRSQLSFIKAEMNNINAS